jgi:rhodanese-related sulfurtransferase
VEVDVPGSMTVAELARGLETRALVALDPRDAEVFAGAHIPGSWSATPSVLVRRLRDSDDALFSALFSGRARRVCVVADTDEQAAAATALLAEVGLTDVATLPDGVRAWRRSGRPVNRAFGPHRETVTAGDAR